MDLYLHIGTEKTGSSSIQEFLATNRDLLRNHGILFPQSPGRINHLGIASLAQGADRGGLWRKLGIGSLEERDAYAKDLEHRLDEELGSHSFTTAIMSNEHCSSRLTDAADIETLREFLARFFSNIRIIVYLRRQDDFLISTYSTGIKTGRTDPPHLPTKRAMKFRYNYWALLQRWTSVFGRDKVVCRKFEKTSFLSGNLITDFLTAAACDPNWEWHNAGSVNSSLDARALEFLRLMNLHVGVDKRPPRLVPMLESISDGPLIDLPERRRKKMMKKFRDSNALVANEYFGGELTDSDDPLFLPRADTRDRTCTTDLTAEEIVAITAKLLSFETAPGRSRNRPTATGS